MKSEFWDEERWEVFLRENDRQVERYMSLLFRFMSDNPPPHVSDVASRESWERQLRTYLLSNGVRPDAEADDNWGEDDLDIPTEEVPYFEADESDQFDILERLPVYSAAHQLAGRVLRWSNRLPGHVKDSTLVQFCSHVTQIPAYLAKGHGIGYEMEMIGGNIACSKRALGAANEALLLLRELKHSAYLDADLYASLYEHGFNLRNDIGIYVQDLRARFDLGVD